MVHVKSVLLVNLLANGGVNKRTGVFCFIINTIQLMKHPHTLQKLSDNKD